MKDNLHVPPPSERLTIKEACATCGCGERPLDPTVIMAWIKDKKVRAWKPGKHWQIDKYTLMVAYRATENRCR